MQTSQKYLPAFYMVLSDKSEYTRVRHPSLELAKREARRLGAENPGVKFWVLAAMGCCLKEDPVQWVQTVNAIDEAEIPF